MIGRSLLHREKLQDVYAYSLCSLNRWVAVISSSLLQAGRCDSYQKSIIDVLYSTRCSECRRVPSEFGVPQFGECGCWTACCTVSTYWYYVCKAYIPPVGIDLLKRPFTTTSFLKFKEPLLAKIDDERVHTR